jgi:uncharacterized protein YndB with AHSA1/START domain
VTNQTPGDASSAPMSAHAAAERRIDAPAERVYRCIADFREHHHRFLPPAFSDFRVEAGGVGDGTVASFRLTVGGQTRSVRTRVVEPVPGRVQTETEVDRPTVTTFTVTPDGTGCRARIETAWRPASGLGGLVERLVAPRLLRRLYADELERLDQYARSLVGG